jgi:hypothetical protein
VDAGQVHDLFVPGIYMGASYSVDVTGGRVFAFVNGTRWPSHALPPFGNLDDAIEACASMIVMDDEFDAAPERRHIPLAMQSGRASGVLLCLLLVHRSIPGALRATLTRGASC